MKYELQSKVLSTMMGQNQAENEELAECLADILEQSLEHLKNCDTTLYSTLENKIYILLYGNHLNETMACDWVSKMSFTKGQPMTKEQTDMIAKQANIDFNNTNFNCWDWYAIVNLGVSIMFDYASATEDYADFALAFFRDPSAVDGKAYNYYKYLIK